MENNENEFSNPIAKARQEALKNAQENMKVQSEENVEPVKKPFPITVNAFKTDESEETIEGQENFEEKLDDLNSEELIPSNDVPTMENVQENKEEQVETAQNVATETPKKEKKEKQVRIINSNDAVITPEDIKESRKYAWLAYVLFFIPLLINKSNAYVRHNANEGLEIFIFDVLASILLILNATVNSANLVVSFIFMLGGILGVGLFILTTITKIYMIVATALGKRVNTPWLWNFRIIK